MRLAHPVIKEEPIRSDKPIGSDKSVLPGGRVETVQAAGSVVGTGLAESELTLLLEVARQKTAARGQRLIWYTPTQYCGFDPMALDLGVKGCTAALYNMCVEPDGGLLPCQSYYHQLGNLLADDWDSIWNHGLAVKLRERQGLPEKCNGCALLAECDSGCPLQFKEIYHSVGPAESPSARSREPEKCE